MNDVKILENLLKIPSPSGFEYNLANYIQDLLIPAVKKENIRIDKHNNLIVNFDYGKKKTIVIDAHLDEIGFVVTNVSRYGSISMDYIGGGDSTILTARNLNILTSNGVVPAVIDRKHAHLVRDEDDELNYVPTDADVDIGIRDREKILKLIEIGDPIVYEHNFRALTEGFYSGYGFDDKAGCFMLIKTIIEIAKSKRKPDVNVVFVFSSQEEIGKTKLRPIVRNIRPDHVMSLDVTFATDYGLVDDMESEAGRCNLGEGIVFYRGVDIDNNLVDLAKQIANKNKIPYQIQASAGDVGNNASYLTGEYEGLKASCWGIPLRNMHAPTEMININDLLSGSKLLTKFLTNKKLKGLL